MKYGLFLSSILCFERAFAIFPTPIRIVFLALSGAVSEHTLHAYTVVDLFSVGAR